MYAVATVLDDIGETALSNRYSVSPETSLFEIIHFCVREMRRYSNWLQCMTNNARTVFYNATQHGFRTVTTIANTAAPPTMPGNYGGDTGVLDDPYEGELFTVWMTLFGGEYFTTAEIDAMWVAKRGKLSVAVLQTPEGPISTERGWWMSSHEKWKVGAPVGGVLKGEQQCSDFVFGR